MYTVKYYLRAHEFIKKTLLHLILLQIKIKPTKIHKSKHAFYLFMAPTIKKSIQMETGKFWVVILYSGEAALVVCFIQPIKTDAALK